MPLHKLKPRTCTGAKLGHRPASAGGCCPFCLQLKDGYTLSKHVKSHQTASNTITIDSDQWKDDIVAWKSGELRKKARSFILDAPTKGLWWVLWVPTNAGKTKPQEGAGNNECTVFHYFHENPPFVISNSAYVKEDNCMVHLELKERE